MWNQGLRRRNNYLAGIVFFLLLVMAPQILQMLRIDYYLTFLQRLLIFTIAVCGINFSFGYTGLIVLCQGTFYGIGAYATAIAMVKGGFSYWWALPVGILSSALVGLALGLITLRLHSHYFATATLCLTIIVESLVIQLRDLTGGPTGVLGIPHPSFFGHILDKSHETYYLALIGFIICYFIMYNIIRSPIRRAMVAIRESESAAKSVGIDVYWYKNLALTLGAVFAGFSGALYVPVYTYVDPTVVGLELTFLLLWTTIIGGRGTFVGPLLGSVTLLALPDLLFTKFEIYLPILYGVLVMGCILYLPEGIMGPWNKFRDLRVAKRLELQREKGNGKDTQSN